MSAIRPAIEPGEHAARYVVYLEPVSDDVDARAGLLACLRDARETLENRLTHRAGLQLGPAFVVELGELRQDAAIRAVVIVGAAYRRSASSGAASKLIAFATTIQEEFERALGILASTVEMNVAAEPVAAVPAPEANSWDRMAPVLGTIVGGAGIVAFVTFVGGAVQYGRFAGAGLPAAEAVSVVPPQTLVVIGAETLIPAVLFGLMYAAGLFVVRETVGRNRIVRKGVRRARPSVARALLLAAWVLCAEVVILGWFDSPGTDDAWRVAGTIASLFGLPVLVGCIAFRTAGALWLAAASFVAVWLFASGLKVVRAWDNNDVRGAALVREHQKGVVGFFVAENDDRVYLGQLEFENPRAARGDADVNAVLAKRSRIIAVDKREVSELAIGPPQRPRAAYDQATLLADRLCDRALRVQSTAAGQQNCWTCPPGVRVLPDTRAGAAPDARRCARGGL